MGIQMLVLLGLKILLVLMNQKQTNKQTRKEGGSPTLTFRNEQEEDHEFPRSEKYKFD